MQINEQNFQIMVSEYDITLALHQSGELKMNLFLFAA